MKKLTHLFKPLDFEFQPFIDEIDAKEILIQKYADATTMLRIKGIILYRVVLDTGRNLMQVYRY